MDDMTKVIEKYYANNASKLRKMVDGIIKKFGGLSQKDTDDFYSLANEVFWIAAKDFNGNGNFNGFLYSRLILKIKSMITERNRKKRANIETINHPDGTVEKKYHHTVSLEAPLYGGNGGSIAELLPSDFDIDKIISDEIGPSFSSDVNEYLDNLPSKTKKMALLISEGYKPCDIIEKMNMTDKEYQIHMDIIQTYEYRKSMEWRYIRSITRHL